MLKFSFSFLYFFKYAPFYLGQLDIFIFSYARPILRIQKQFLRIASSEGLLSLRFKAAWQFLFLPVFYPSINLRVLSYLFRILEIAFFAHIFFVYILR